MEFTVRHIWHMPGEFLTFLGSPGEIDTIQADARDNGRVTAK